MVIVGWLAAKRETISAVLSFDPSLTTMTLASALPCVATEMSVSSIYRAALYAGMTTSTRPWFVLARFVAAVSLKGHIDQKVSID